MATKALTDAQPGAVTVVLDEKTREQFYLVQPATDATVTYQVRWNKRFSRWSCQCKGNASGYVCYVSGYSDVSTSAGNTNTGALPASLCTT